MQKPVEVYRVCLSLGSFYPSEVNFHCLLPLKILVCFAKLPIYLWWSDLRQGPIFSGAYWKVFYVVFLVCITASLDLMSLHCNTEKEKIVLFFPCSSFSEKHISWLYEYWWLLPAPCHLRCCQKNPEKGEENLYSLKIEPLRKKTCKTGFAFFL